MANHQTTNNPGEAGHEPDPTGKAREEARSAAENVKAEARDMAGKVSHEAAQYADRARESAASEVSNISSALRTAADELRRGSPQERTFSQLADSLADASDAVRDKDLGEMVESLDQYARRNPTVFLAGAALLGFAATRFAKASSRQAAADRTGGPTPHRGGGAPGGAAPAPTPGTPPEQTPGAAGPATPSTTSGGKI